MPFLEALAKGIAACYQPEYVDEKAFERLAGWAGVDSDLVKILEKTDRPTVYDALAQFSVQYSGSLERSCQEFPGVVIYYTPEKHLHATGNVNSIKQIKNKRK